MSSETVHIVAVQAQDHDVVALSLKYENEPAHGFQTLKCLDALRRERQLCDVILTVEGHELFAHRAVLSCHSNYFLELFLGEDSESLSKKPIYYQIDGLEHTAVKLIIQFIYQGSFLLTSDMVSKVYSAAHKLRVETIFKACSNYLAEQLNEENCLSTRLMAMDDDLRSQATECIQKNFSVLLETREFKTLPSIKLELIDSNNLNATSICDLIFSWILRHQRKDNSNLQELCDYMHLVYLNGDKTLHDCGDMDENNIHFSDIIKDYQSYKLTKRNLSTSSTSSNAAENPLFETTTVQVLNNNLPSNSTNISQTPETKVIHMGQSADHIYIMIGIIKGKMFSVAIHISSTTVTTPTTSETGEYFPTEKTNDDPLLTNGIISTLNGDKDVPLASLSNARCGFGIVSSNGSIFAVGGYDRGYCLDTIEQFDPIENKWTSLPAVMTSRRGRISAAVVNNKIYVCGGSDGQRELNTGECLDLTVADKWTPIEDLPCLITHGAMCSDESYVYLLGGSEGDICTNECYRYDPQENDWSTLSPMNCGRSQAAAVYFDGKLYVFGGYVSSRCLSSCEIYNLSTNQWSIGPSMRENRRGCGAVVYKNKIYIVGGSNGVTSLTSIEIYDPINNEWFVNTNNSQNDLNVARVGGGIAVCDEKLYVVGGFDGRNFLKTIEIFDETSQRWRLSSLISEKINGILH